MIVSVLRSVCELLNFDGRLVSCRVSEVCVRCEWHLVLFGRKEVCVLRL